MVHAPIIYLESLDSGVCRELGNIRFYGLRKTHTYILPNRSSAVLAIGAATLADIFDPSVRGQKVG